MTTGDARLVGTYRLVSVEHTDQDGAVGRPFGDAPTGFMTYTADGYMFVMMMQADRPLFAGGDILGGTVDERAGRRDVSELGRHDPGTALRLRRHAAGVDDARALDGGRAAERDRHARARLRTAVSSRRCRRWV